MKGLEKRFIKTLLSLNKSLSTKDINIFRWGFENGYKQGQEALIKKGWKIQK